jgi:uncharacterized membrane protein YfhO
LLVVSEVFYEPGWQATLDGDPVEIHRANWLLRAVKVPPGRHELVMRFDPPAFKLGATLSIGAYALILLALAASVVLERRRGAPVSTGEPNPAASEA